MRVSKRIHGLIFISITLLSTLLSYSQIPEGYYDRAIGISGKELSDSLHEIIKGHQFFPYTSDTIDTWDILKESDCDTIDSENVILIYSGYAVEAAGEYYAAKSWSREHVWARSRGRLGTIPPAGTDVHNLKPADVGTNAARSNRWFGEANLPYNTKGDSTGNFIGYDEWVWEPRDPVKGDIARIMFYMDVRYNGDNGEPNLNIIDSIPTDNYTNDGVCPNLSTLIRWHIQDPVDDWERNRNDVIYRYQQNRNPFIDHPEFVILIWNNLSLQRNDSITIEH